MSSRGSPAGEPRGAFEPGCIDRLQWMLFDYFNGRTCGGLVGILALADRRSIAGSGDLTVTI